MIDDSRYIRFMMLQNGLWERLAGNMLMINRTVENN
jgi:hypothetical protein